jgi:hypothetical protein
LAVTDLAERFEFAPDEYWATICANEPISIKLVQFVLAKLKSRGSNPVTNINRKPKASFPDSGNELTAVGNAANMDAVAQHSCGR